MRRRVVLIVAREAAKRAALARTVQAAGYTVELAEAAPRARQLAAAGGIDLAVVADRPTLAIAGLVDALREDTGRMIVVAAPGASERPPGGTIVLPPDFGERQLLDGITRLLGQTGNGSIANGGRRLRFGDRTLDLDGHVLLDGSGQEVALTRNEFALLEILLRNPGRVLSREQLRNALDGGWHEAYERSVDMLVSRLRRKIEADPRHPQMLLTVTGAGYKFAVRPREDDPEASPEDNAVAEPAATPSGTAEQRDLTVLVCTIGGLARLASDLDPEQVRAAAARVRRLATLIIKEFGGYLAGFLGDVLTAYFGYPGAHEDDAERAIRAGIDVAAAIGAEAEDGGPRLHARIGIATGAAVVGDVGMGDHAHAAIGEVLLVASRLSAAADPGCVVIAAETRRRAGRSFEYRDLDRVQIDPALPPVAIWRVTGAAPPAGRFADRRDLGVSRFVGRAEELALLHQRWHRACHGNGQVVLITGEPGIGKSRLVFELERSIAGHEPVSIRLFGSPHYINAPLYPIARHLERAAGFEHGDSPSKRREKLAALLATSGIADQDAMPVLASLLSLPHDRESWVRGLSPQRRKDKIFDALRGMLAQLAATQPILMAVEDVQWLDPTSLEMVALEIERAAQLPLLLLITARPAFVPPWPDHAHLTRLAIGRLAADEAAALVKDAAGQRAISAGLLDAIVARGDGIPLFLEELARDEVTRASHRDVSSAPAKLRQVPPSLQGLLLARIDRLDPASKAIAQIGALIGRSFSHALLQRLRPPGVEPLDVVLDRLSQAEIVLRRGAPPEATYVFRHALVQDAAYGTLPESRRRELHGLVARTLEQEFPDIAEAQPDVLARQHAEAGNIARACDYLMIATERSLLHAAGHEALVLIETALRLLSQLPEDDARRHQELGAQLLFHRVALTTRGHTAAAVSRALRRARELGEALDDRERLPFVIYGQWGAAWGGAAWREAIDHARALLAYGERTQNATARTFGYFTAGASLLGIGELADARRQLESAVALNSFTFTGSDLLTWGEGVARAAALLSLDLALFLLGCPDEADAVAQSAAEMRAISQPYSQSIVLSMTCRRHAVRRDAARLRDTATAYRCLTEEHGYPHFGANAAAFLGWAMALTGDPDQGLELASTGIRHCQAIGFRSWMSMFLAMLAECQARAGQPERGLETIGEALEFADATGERFWEPELYRLQGEIATAAGRDACNVEAALRRAIASGVERGAGLLVLRSAGSLARHLVANGRCDEARATLIRACEPFGAAAGLPELDDARAFLAALAGS